MTFDDNEKRDYVNETEAIDNISNHQPLSINVIGISNAEQIE